MRPAELKREIERLTVDAATAREQLDGLRQTLRAALGLVGELRHTLAGYAPVASPRTPEPQKPATAEAGAPE